MSFERVSIPSLILVSTLALSGCGGGAEPAPGSATEEPAGTAATEPAKVYALRGEVTAVPGEDDPRLGVHHEAIPDFEVGGEVVGMDAMTMRFAPAEGVSLEGVEVGTKVAFDWRITPDVPAGEIVHLEILPEDAALDFGAAEGDGSMDHEGAGHGEGGDHAGHGS